MAPVHFMSHMLVVDTRTFDVNILKAILTELKILKYSLLPVSVHASPSAQD